MISVNPHYLCSQASILFKVKKIIIMKTELSNCSELVQYRYEYACEICQNKIDAYYDLCL